jgi:hypothetical protein
MLALEDGSVFEGRGFGAPTERSGEVVFKTALTGYQEVFTDPSYSVQIAAYQPADRQLHNQPRRIGVEIQPAQQLRRPFHV